VVKLWAFLFKRYFVVTQTGVVSMLAKMEVASPVQRRALVCRMKVCVISCSTNESRK
jgi:hypothetical protein